MGAAYLTGAFDWPAGLDEAAFTEQVYQEAQHWQEIYGLFARNVELKPGEVGDGMVGIVFASIKNELMEPHAIWFQWATRRNIMETAVRFFVETRKEFKVIVFSKPETRTFFTHLCKYGLLRRVGTFKNFFPDDDDAAIFQGRRVNA